MISFREASRFLNKLPSCYLTPVRLGHITNYNPYKPKAYPKTQKEREEAARKYGIELEEYEAYPDDGDGYGEYPKLPILSYDDKDPNYPWDYPERRRNFNEPVHIFFHFTGDTTVNINKRTVISKWKMFRFAVIYFCGGLSSLFLLSQHFPLMKRVSEKQYPLSGNTYYTFELE